MSGEVPVSHTIDCLSEVRNRIDRALANDQSWQLRQRIYEFRKFLASNMVDSPELIEQDYLAHNFEKAFVRAQWLWCALQKSPQRNMSGVRGAMKYVGNVINRSSAYRFIAETLGVGIDDFRCARSREELLDICPGLKEKLANVSAEYDRLYRANNPSAPSLCQFEKAEEGGGANTDENVLLG